nr:CCR4-NOT transcription complex subunit 9 isoform X1 [Oryza sativa Japonica Group]
MGPRPVYATSASSRPFVADGAMWTVRSRRSVDPGRPCGAIGGERGDLSPLGCSFALFRLRRRSPPVAASPRRPRRRRRGAESGDPSRNSGDPFHFVLVRSVLYSLCCGDNGESAALAFHSALLRRGLAAIAFSDRRRWRGRRGGAASQGYEDGVGGAAGARPLRPRASRERPPRALEEKRDISRSGPTSLAFFWNSCCTSSGNCVNLLCTFTPNIVTRCIEPSLQCTCTSSAHIPLYLYPFLNTTSKTRPFEYLRLTSLGVIGALVKVDDTEVISFLLQTEIIPLCLRTMEMGSELSKTVATFIVQKILLDDVGLRYICATAERFFAVGSVLANMVVSLAEQPSTRLLKHIIRCYLRLSDNSRACAALQTCLPDMLKDGTFNNCLRDDPTTRRWLQQLLLNVTGAGMGAAPQPGLDHMMGI